jgi:replication factor C small subunit
VLIFELVIRPNNKNLFKFFSKIGYAYEHYKIQLAKLSAEYLRHKLYLINVWQKKSKLVAVAVNNGCTIRQAAQEFEVTSDFVSNQIKGKDVHLPRNQFFSFDEWVRKYKFNDLLIVNDIYEIKKVNEDLVMDITCQNDHNFITNGFISHNCNYSSKIIDPIQSRCAMFRFKPLDKAEIFAIIEKIEKDENIAINEKAKEALFNVSGGDARKINNILQSSAAISKDITEEIIYSMASVAKPKEIDEVLKLALQNKFIEARSKLMDVMLNYGLSGLDIIKQIQQEILNLDINNENKMKLMEKCGEIEFRLTEGSDEFIQLEALLSQFVLYGSKK